MPYAFTYDVPADERFYRRVRELIGDDYPHGLIVHLTIKRPEGGLRHIDVWESQEDWVRFRDERSDPAVDEVLAAAGIPGRPGQPVEQEMDVIDVWGAPQAATR